MYKYSLCFVFLDDATFDGTRLIWEMPRILTPLVLHVAQFQDKQITMGVEGILLNAPTLRTRGYNLSVNTIVKISIPYGAEGGYLKVREIPELAGACKVIA